MSKWWTAADVRAYAETAATLLNELLTRDQESRAEIKRLRDAILRYRNVGVQAMDCYECDSDGPCEDHSEEFWNANNALMQEGDWLSGEGTGRRCRECGCTDNHACRGGCFWVEDDLCSQCADGEAL